MATPREGEKGDAITAFIVAGVGFLFIMINAYFSSRRNKYTVTLNPIKQAIIYPNGLQVPFLEIEEPWVREGQISSHLTDGTPGGVKPVYSLILNGRGRILQLGGYSRESLEKIGRLLVAMKQEAERRAAKDATTVSASILDSAPRASENATYSDRPTDGRSSGRPT